MGIKKSVINRYPPIPWGRATTGSVKTLFSAVAGTYSLIPAPGPGKFIQLGIGVDPNYFGYIINPDVSVQDVYLRANSTNIYYYWVVAGGDRALNPSPISLPENTALDVFLQNNVDTRLYINYTIRDMNAEKVGSVMVLSNGTNWVDLLGPPPAGKMYCLMQDGPWSFGHSIMNNDTAANAVDIRLYDGVREIRLREFYVVNANRFAFVDFFMPVIEGNWRLQFRLFQAETANPIVVSLPYGIADAV